MDHIKKYVEENKERFLEELFGLLRIPSISSIADHKPDMQKCAEYWRDQMLKAGADKAQVMPTDGHPVVYGEKIIDPSAPTVLVYAHYDVMPVDPIELWETQPFEPVIRDGKIFARGADDDKGQGFMHAKAFELMLKTNTLPCNVKFMIEGEEEVGSPNLGKWLDQNKDLLKADVILVSDTSLLGKDEPSITTGLRGLAYVEVEVTGPNRDLHSGLFGGAVANPINILSKMIASLHDENNHIIIPGFYDDVMDVAPSERAEMNKAPFSLDDYKKALDVNEVWGETGYTTLERVGSRPTLDVNGIWGGYIGEGAKTVLPSKAYAKISMRLVPNQEHNKIAELFGKHFESIAPPYVKVKVKHLHGGQGYVSPTDSPAYKAASKAMEETYGKKPIPYRSGGSIPIISTFEEKLGLKTILLGFGLESDAIHSPNENYPLEQFYKGIETIPLFYKYFAESMKK
jgi:acetylornithine deacetylase/succinyl-diaminopimelate desuccinylase-like protein